MAVDKPAGFFLTPEYKEDLDQLLQWARSLNGEGVDNSRQAVSLAPHSHQQVSGQSMPIVIACRLTSAISGRVGWYNAKSAMKPANPNPTGDLAETDISMGWRPADDVVVQYLPDMGASAASITDFSDANIKNLVVVGLFRAFDTTLGRRIVVAGAGSGGKAIPVKLTSDGGSDGDGSTACSYTYTVKDLDDNSVLDGTGTPLTHVAPTHRRNVTHTLTGTRGTLGRKADGTYELYQTDEIPDFRACTA